MTRQPALRRQHGSASLLVALVLMMAMTLLTLSVARTQLAETRTDGNSRWHTRLSSVSESEWGIASAVLTDAPDQLVWVPSSEGKGLMSQMRTGETAEGLETTLLYQRTDTSSRVIDIQAITSQTGRIGLSGRTRQAVRLLTVLSPLAETAPPLVINGCLAAESANIHIRPINSDTDTAGDALWHFAGAPCPAFESIDRHGGRIARKPLEGPLWSTFFSISRDDYAQLATSDLSLAAEQRRYWWVATSGLIGGEWNRSLGSADAPVVVYFPQTTGCPRFSAGVRIFGVVFIAAACAHPLAATQLEVVGNLVINGDASAGHATVQLNHIRAADGRQSRLSLPTIRAVKIPGSWRDF
jgi:hypothetical protein